MNYKLIENIQDTWFYEFLPGKYKLKSVFISSEAIELIYDCLHIANNNFSLHAQTTVYTKEKGQIQLLRDQLLIKFTEIADEKDFSGKFSPKLINELKKYKEEILIMIQSLIDWIDNNLKVWKLTIIGTQDKFADLILSDPNGIIFGHNGRPMGRITNDVPQDILDEVL